MMMNKTTFPKFSFFPGPITNIRPNSTATIPDVHRGLTSNYYKLQTAQLRTAKEAIEKRNAKKKLDYVTFAGTFRLREKNGLIELSGYVCIDLDHIEPHHIEVIKLMLLNDKMFKTELLFVSPSGTGLKWIVEVDLNTCSDYETNFKGIVSYLIATYPDNFKLGDNIIDTNCKDASRACFLCYDPDAYINPKYLNNGAIKI